MLGAELVAPSVCKLIAEKTLAIKIGATVTDMVSTVYSHPTLTEEVREVAMDVTGRTIHITNR